MSLKTFRLQQRRNSPSAGGRFYDLSGDPNRKLCRLHIALMDRMGVKTNHFGDAENALAI